MKTIMIALILMCLVIPGIAANNKSEPSGNSACAGAAHAHQYSDVRMAVIEVSNVSLCGFSFIDLEENTVGMDNSFEFDHDFEVVRIEQSGEKTSNFAKVSDAEKSCQKRDARDSHLLRGLQSRLQPEAIRRSTRRHNDFRQMILQRR